MKSEQLIVFSGLLISTFFTFYFLLFRRIEKGGRKYIFAGMLFSFYVFLYDFLFLNGYYNFAIWLYLLYIPIIFAFYPIIYHYLVYTINDANHRVIVKVFSYLPYIVFVMLVVFYLPLNNQQKIEFISKDINSFENSSGIFLVYQLLLHTLYYIQFIIFVTIFYQFYVKQKKQKIVNSHSLFLPSWLFLLVTIIISYEFVYSLIIIFDFAAYSKVVEAIANFLFLFFLGFLGIYHDVMLISMKLKSTQVQSAVNPYATQQKELYNNDRDSIINQIDSLIKEQKLYENPGLKLEHIAKKLHLPVKKVSQIINQQIGNNFSFYLNTIRIDEAKNIMQIKKENQKIEDIYLKVGYYTRSTFNRAFKTIEGQTPSEYLNSNS